jgi:hypothetical protein
LLGSFFQDKQLYKQLGSAVVLYDHLGALAVFFLVCHTLGRFFVLSASYRFEMARDRISGMGGVLASKRDSIQAGILWRAD